MGGLKIKKYLLFLAFMLMITSYLPIFSRVSRFGIGVHSYWAILWFVSLFFLIPRALGNKNFLYILFFMGIFVLLLLSTIWVNVDEWSKRETRLEVLSFLVPMSLYSYFTFSKDFSGLAILVKWTIFFIAVTAILSIFTTTIDPLYVRNFGSYSEAEIKALSKFGGGGYGFTGALVFLFPIIIYYYRNSSKIPYNKPIILIFGIVCFIAVLRMQIFANIILSVFVIIISLAGTRRIRKSLVFTGMFLIMFVLIPKHFYSDFLIDASSHFKPDSDVSFKLNDMATFIKLGNVSEETSTGGRIERYPLLWEGFKSNPLLGVYNSDSTLDISPGGHLYWMHKLTVYGILAFIPFILIFYFHIKKVIKQFDPEYTFYFLLSVFSGLGLGLIKSLYGRDFWTMFFFIIPGLYYFPLLKKKAPTTGKRQLRQDNTSLTP